MLANSVINLITVDNPFDPTKQTRDLRILKGEETLIDFVPVLWGKYVVSVNGGIVPEEKLGTTSPKPGDTVVVFPTPQGGDGGSKNILRMVAMIAVSIAAPYAAVGMLGTATAGTVGALTATGMIATAAITLAGSMLINALLPPSMPSSDNFNQGLEESRSYGIDGAKNTSTEDTVVPLVYGKFRVAGNRIATHIVNDGNTQQLYMLFNAGEGPIAGISDVRVNDQPKSNYQGVSTRQRVGSGTQQPIDWFNKILTPVSKGITLSTSFALHTTTGEVDKLRIDITAPGGIAYYNDQGGVDYVSVDMDIQYREVGTSTWIPMPNVNKKTGDTQGYYYTDTEVETTTLRAGTSVSGSTVIDNATGDQVGVVQDVPTYSTAHKIGGKGRQAIRRSYESPKLPEAQYEVRVKRLNSESEDNQLVDSITWSEINEILTERVAYRHTALLGMSITLSDQLNSIPNVSYLHHGKLVKVRRVQNDSVNWTFEASSNPAWVAYDILTNARYGGRIQESRININRWQEWADYCEASGLEFNGVFDTQNNVWDSLMHVFRVGHAQIVNQGTRYTVAMEKPDEPVMMFNSTNMIEKSFKVNWLPKAERSNEVEITYWDKDNDYKRTMIKVRDDDVSPNDPVKTARMTMFGVVNAEQAKKEAVFQLNLNKHILRTAEFDASIEAIACTVGDLILVQNEMSSWGIGGRADEGSTGSVLKLDREVEVQAGNSYKVLVNYDSVSRATGTVSGVVSNIVWLNGYDGRTDVSRIIINSNDHQIKRIVNDGFGGYGVEIDDVSAVINGQSYEIFETDVIEERNVTNTAGTYTELTVDSAFSTAPAFRTKWMFGTVETIKRPFRVQSISGSGDYERTISALEYVEEVYDLTTDNIIPTYESTVAISQVRGLTIDNTWLKSGDTYAPVAELGWEIPAQGYYGGAIIYMAKNGDEQFRKVAEVGSQELNYTHVGMTVGETADFKVVAKDIIDQKATYSTAPTIAYTALARPETGIPTNLAVTTQGGNYILTWNNPTEAFKNIEVWRSTTDDVATASKINAVTGESYTDANAPLGTPVYYWVRTINADGLTGEWNAVNGATTTPPGQVSNLTATSFTGRSVEISWDALAEAKDYIVEVNANSTISRAQATSETSYRYTIEDAIQDANVGRAITFIVKPRLQDNTVGANASVVATNPQIATAVSNLELGTTGDAITVSFSEKTESDLAGYKIHASQTPGFTPGPSNLIYQGRAAGTIFPVGAGETWYVVVGAYDVWGEDGIAYSGESGKEATTSALIASQLTDQIDRSHLAGVLEGELDALGNEWTMKVSETSADGTKYVAGIGLSVESGESGALSSNFLVKADTFAVIPSDASAAGDATLPFIISGGDVFMNSAYIENGSITNAKIGNVIQSNSYSATSGWKIDKAGAAEFTELTIRDSDGNVLLSSGGGGTTLSSDIANAGSGVNIANAEYSVWEEELPALATSAAATVSLDNTISYFGSNSLKVEASAIDARVFLSDVAWDGYNIKLTPNKKWLCSFYVYCNQASAAGALSLRTADGPSNNMTTFTTPATANQWVRVYMTVDLTADNSTQAQVFLDNDGGAGCTMWFDGLMVEELLGPNEVPSAYVLPAGAGGGGVSDYADLTGAPTSLADINATEGSKLTGVESGATNGATFGTNISGQITSANVSTYIASAAIQTAQIGNGQITNAKIGDVIQSNGYVAGSSGWKIDKNGNMELNSAVYRGTIDVKSSTSGARLEIKSDVIKVYDSTGTLRVKLGNLSA